MNIFNLKQAAAQVYVENGFVYDFSSLVSDITSCFSLIFIQTSTEQENQYSIETYNLWDFNKHTLKMGKVKYPAVLNLNRVIPFSFCSILWQQFSNVDCMT